VEQSDGSARKQAREWFESFLMEAENEVHAVAAGKAARAESPARVFIEEFEHEREAWEAKSKELLLSRAGGDDAELQRLSNTCSGSKARDDDMEFSAENGIPEAIETVDVEEPRPEAIPEAIEAADVDEHSPEGGQILAALLEAGLEPGVAAAHALAAAASESTLAKAATPLSAIPESGCPLEADGDMDGGSRDGVAQWALPARQWAAARLRRKRERKQSGLGTPCGSTSEAPENA